MSDRLELPFKSQYDADILEQYRQSACGPVTAYVILEYLDNCHSYDVNTLYRLLGSTKAGLFTHRFLRGMKKILGNDWLVKPCHIEDVKTQLHKGFPVAAKFDKWFTFRWHGRYDFDYHWVPVVGWEETDEDCYLWIHDNGSRLHPSRLRKISYQKNKNILRFIKIEPVHHKCNRK